MHEFFLTARSLYLLVLGERDDMAERDAAPKGETTHATKSRSPDGDRRNGEPWANLQRCGKAGDAEGKRLPTGEVAICATADESLPVRLSS